MTSSVEKFEEWILPEAIAAACWWGDQLRFLVGIDPEDYPSPAGMLYTTAPPAGDVALNSYELDEPRIRRFEVALAKAITARLEMPESEVVELRVDIDPHKLLFESLGIAGIPSVKMLLPPQALMTVEDGVVRVRPYNGTQFERIPIG